MNETDAIQERRRHPRYKVNDNILVYNENSFAQIIDFSKGGLAFRYLTSRDDSPDKNCNIGLLNSVSGNHLSDIPCQLIRTDETGPIHPAGSTVIRTYALKFKDMTDAKRKEINDFFKDHLIGDSATVTEH